MSMVINTNTASLVAQAAQAKTSSAMDTAMERLSTGKRINTAADDAAGIAISTRMESQIRGVSMAMKNAGDAQALIDTAEGAQVRYPMFYNACVSFQCRQQMIQTLDQIV